MQDSWKDGVGFVAPAELLTERSLDKSDLWSGPLSSPSERSYHHRRCYVNEASLCGNGTSMRMSKALYFQQNFSIQMLEGDRERGTGEDICGGNSYKWSCWVKSCMKLFSKTLEQGFKHCL